MCCSSQWMFRGSLWVLWNGVGKISVLVARPRNINPNDVCVIILLNNYCGTIEN